MAYEAPCKLKDPEKIKRQCDEFFDECDEKKDPYTITGLGLKLKISRQEILIYTNRTHKNQDSNYMELTQHLRDAKSKCEYYAEKGVLKATGNVTGFIFALKNYGWKDQQEIITKTSSDLEELSDEDLEKLMKRYKK